MSELKLELVAKLSPSKTSPLGVKIDEVEAFFNENVGPFFEENGRLNHIGLNMFVSLIAQGAAILYKMGEEDGKLNPAYREKQLEFLKERILRGMNNSGETFQKRHNRTSLN